MFAYSFLANKATLSFSDAEIMRCRKRPRYMSEHETNFHTELGYALQRRRRKLGYADPVIEINTPTCTTSVPECAEESKVDCPSSILSDIDAVCVLDSPTSILADIDSVERGITDCFSALLARIDIAINSFKQPSRAVVEESAAVVGGESNVSGERIAAGERPAVGKRNVGGRNVGVRTPVAKHNVGGRNVGERNPVGKRNVGERIVVGERTPVGKHDVGERSAGGKRDVGERSAGGKRDVGERGAGGRRIVAAERTIKNGRKVRVSLGKK